jgi:hypothetical protein
MQASLTLSSEAASGIENNPLRSTSFTVSPPAQDVRSRGEHEQFIGEELRKASQSSAPSEMYSLPRST